MNSEHKLRIQSDSKVSQRNHWMNKIPSSNRRELTQKKLQMSQQLQHDMLERIKADFQSNLMQEYQREERIKRRKMKDMWNRRNNSELQKR